MNQSTRPIPVFEVHADSVTGEWLRYEFTGEYTTRDAWHEKIDTLDIHYDTAEHLVPDVDQTSAVIMYFVD